VIFIAAISIALFIAALILAKKEKHKSDVILFIWMILNATHIAFFYLTFTEAIYDFPFLLGWAFPLPLLHGVLLYLYVTSVSHQLPKKKLALFAHFIPAILTIGYLIPFFLLPAEQKIEVFKKHGEGYETFLFISLLATCISGIVYVGWSTHLIRIHKKRIREEFSNLAEINLKWLQFITYGLGIVWSLIIFSQDDGLIFMGVSIFVILIGFFGIQQKNIFHSDIAVLSGDRIQEQIQEPTASPKEKYSSSGLSEEKEKLYYDQLEVKMREEKIFTNIELSLSELAASLDIPPNYLSQVINTREGKTFYDYVNKFRVEEFQKLVADPKKQHLTLIALAFESGFNSKSSFNRYFKKVTGQTPSQYVKALRG